MKDRRRSRFTRGQLLLTLVLALGSFLYFKTVYWTPHSWERHIQAGLRAQNRGDFAEAEREFLAALSDARDIPDHQLALRHTLNNLVEVYRSQAKYDEAVATIRQIIEIDESKLGPDHPNVAASWNNLAEVYRSQGRRAEAEQAYRRALDIFEKSLGPNHALTGFVRERYREFLGRPARPPKAPPAPPEEP